MRSAPDPPLGGVSTSDVAALTLADRLGVERRLRAGYLAARRDE
jgi:hypothetical protein